MSINIFPSSLTEDGFPEFIKRAAQEYAVPTDRICLEIIESSITNMSAVEELSSLRAHGFKIPIDDFGWGFSSLSRLLELPADIVKFDRKFLHQGGDSSELRSFLLLARDLVKSCHITTLAEGVESELDWSIVRDVGFDYAQGYWLGVPLAENEVVQLLRES